MPGILIIGYGNALRGDDAVGLHAARELERYFHNDAQVEVIACQQLTPELADDISRSDLVLFLDASHDGEPGTVKCKSIVPSNTPVGFTHDLDAAALVAAAEQLYGDVPRAFVITLAGWSFEMKSQLSRGTQLRLPELVHQAKQLVVDYRRSFLTAADTLSR